MATARIQHTIEYEGAQLMLLQDLSRYTMMKRKAVKPLLDILRQKEISYRWGFPFQIKVHRNGHNIFFRDMGDLPNFLINLQLPLVDLPAWSQIYYDNSGGQYRG